MTINCSDPACRARSRYQALKFTVRLMVIFTVSLLVGGAVGKAAGNYYIGAAVPGIATAISVFATMVVARGAALKISELQQLLQGAADQIENLLEIAEGRQ